MNIFFLDKNPIMAATYQHDKHIVKMPLETAQILSTVLRSKGLEYDWLYKPTHKMHKCVVWAASDWNNFYWLCRFGIALCDEYTYRYDKIHKSKQVIINCLNVLYWVYERKSLNSNKITPPAQAMPEKYQNVDPVVAYRNYYLFEKEFWYKRDKKTNKIISKHLNTWTKRNQPNWWWINNKNIKLIKQKVPHSVYSVTKV